MFGVSLPELLIVFVVALVVLGPEKLPEIARFLGRITAEFRKHSNELRREFYNSVYTPSNELRTSISSETQQLRGVLNLSGTCEDPGLKAPPCPPAGETAAAATTIEQPENTADVEEKKR